MLVGQASMMSGNCISDQLRDDLVIALGKSRDDGRTGGGVIDPFLGACEPRLKLRCIFSEIMQEAGEPRRFGNADPLAKPFGALSRID